MLRDIPSTMSAPKAICAARSGSRIDFPVLRAQSKVHWAPLTVAIITPALGRNNVRSAKTIPVGTTRLLTGKSASAVQVKPNVTPGAFFRDLHARATAAIRISEPASWAPPNVVDATISRGE